MKYVFMFPGQGSQHIGMFNGLKIFHDIEQVYTQASNFLKMDLMKINQSKEVFNPANAQLTLAVHSLAIFNYLTNKYPRLAIKTFMGHSLGEITAMCAAGYISNTDFFSFLIHRTEIINNSVNNEGMLAISGMQEDALNQLCKKEKRFVEIVIQNSNDQFVLAGNKDVLHKIQNQFVANDQVKVKLLPINGAFHCILQMTNNVKLKEYINKINFKDINIPLVSNINADIIRGANNIRQELSNQLISKVNWYKSIKAMIEQSSEEVVFIEVGPGNVLTKLVKQINPQSHVFCTKSIYDLNVLDKFIMHHEVL
ncbi:ACP S-malonyltransferase [Apilactobacillus quenuiae]|uniref:ACP S-malonyltransferase n=1 Tax=Apilactobacillus quenuiae TaxID=2008377 RepID=UPI000D01F13E|nr:ACP S-malonyltransferase [Apilactobacillus quenuiae]